MTKNQKDELSNFKKWAKDLNRLFSNEDIQIAYRYEKMPNITSHIREASLNHNEISPHTCQNVY